MRLWRVLAGVVGAACANESGNPAPAPAPHPPPAAVEAVADVADAGAPVRAPSDAELAAPLFHDAGSGWCTEGLRAMDDETCLVVPESGLASPRTLLVY